MPSAWVEHIKEFAKRKGLTYGCALSDPECSKEYQAKKPPKTSKKAGGAKSAGGENISMEISEKKARGRPKKYETDEERKKAKSAKTIESNKRKKFEKLSAGAEKLEMAVPDMSVKPKGIVIKPRPAPVEKDITTYPKMIDAFTLKLEKAVKKFEKIKSFKSEKAYEDAKLFYKNIAKEHKDITQGKEKDDYFKAKYGANSLETGWATNGENKDTYWDNGKIRDNQSKLFHDLYIAIGDKDKIAFSWSAGKGVGGSKVAPEPPAPPPAPAPTPTKPTPEDARAKYYTADPKNPYARQKPTLSKAKQAKIQKEMRKEEEEARRKEAEAEYTALKESREKPTGKGMATHIHTDGTIMTGKTHTKSSKVIGKVMKGGMLKYYAPYTITKPQYKKLLRILTDREADGSMRMSAIMDYEAMRRELPDFASRVINYLSETKDPDHILASFQEYESRAGGAGKGLRQELSKARKASEALAQSAKGGMLNETTPPSTPPPNTPPSTPPSAGRPRRRRRTDTAPTQTFTQPHFPTPPPSPEPTPPSSPEAVEDEEERYLEYLSKQAISIYRMRNPRKAQFWLNRLLKTPTRPEISFEELYNILFNYWDDEDDNDITGDEIERIEQILRKLRDIYNGDLIDSGAESSDSSSGEGAGLVPSGEETKKKILDSVAYYTDPKMKALEEAFKKQSKALGGKGLLKDAIAMNAQAKEKGLELLPAPIKRKIKQARATEKLLADNKAKILAEDMKTGSYGGGLIAGYKAEDAGGLTHIYPLSHAHILEMCKHLI